MKSTTALTLAALLILLPRQSDAFTALPEGTLIKGPTSAAVYLVTADAKRRPFPLQSVYESYYGKDFSAVINVTAEELASYPLGQSVTFNINSVIKITTDPMVYKVTDSQGHIQWIQTETEFLAQGFQFNQVRDVPDAFFVDYVVVEAPTAPAPPPVVEQPLNPVLRNLTIFTPSATAVQVGFDTEMPTRGTLVITNKSGVLISNQTEFNLTTLGHLMKIDTGISPAQEYHYKLTVTDEQNRQTVDEGAFLSKTDLSIEQVADAPSGGDLLQPKVLVAKLTIKNRTDFNHTLNTLTAIFESDINGTDIPPKTVTLERPLPGPAGVTEAISSKFFTRNTNIRNVFGAVKFQIERVLKPHETDTFLIYIDGLQEVNRADWVGRLWKTRIDATESTALYTYIEEGYYGDLVVKQ